MKQFTPSSDTVAVIGGGFSGLATAWELARAGVSVTVFEAEDTLGGLAADFEVGGTRLDRFYHHWFTNDRAVMDVIETLGLSGDVVLNPTNTGLYFANTIFRLSSPLDLLRFSPLPFIDRIRLGLLALRARRVKDWRALENLTAEEWLRSLGGDRVFETVWKPLLDGKFGPYASDVSAVWFWNKLKLRGGSRGKGGKEQLAYLEGGFQRLAEAMAQDICQRGGEILLGTPVEAVTPVETGGLDVETAEGARHFDQVVATTALPLVARMVSGWAPDAHIEQLTRIPYLGNVCMVLELDRPLSDTYWLNVNDPGFPFVGVIEHTNFERAETYDGRHIVYLSKYLPHTDPLYAMSADDMLEFAVPHLRKMFPAFERDWVQQHHLWRARYSQPVVERNYSALIPDAKGPVEGLWYCSMAQVYPEDRGTNYAIRDGRAMATRLLAEVGVSQAL